MADVFTERAFITLYSVTSGRSVAVHEGLHGGLPNGEGGDGEFARWEVDIDDKKSDRNTKVVRLARKRAVDANQRTTAYLRIYADPHDSKKLIFDGVGGGGEFCYFRVQTDDKQQNYVRLESVAFPNHYFAVSADGKAHVVDRPLPGTNFTVTVADDNPFDNKSGGGSVVRLVVPSTGLSLRIMDGKDNKNGNANVNGKGGIGEFAKFIVHPLGNDTVRLESFKYQDKKHFLRINSNAVDGSGGEGPYTIFVVHKVRPGFYSFESKATPGQRVGVDGHGNATVDPHASHDFFVTRVR